MKRILPLIVSILGTLGAGGLSAWFTGGYFDIYSEYIKPALAPPAVLFPIAWSVLYILMAMSVSLIYKSQCTNKDILIELYIIQLAVNVIWPIIFFKWQLFFAAFLWIVLLWILIALMIILFYRCRKAAAYLLIPYFLWVTFAAYLNFSFYLLN